VSSAK